jgi:hypothetical protein
MQKIVETILPLFVLLAMLFAITGCVEHRYYRQYHHHSHRYYDRHHTPPPPGVNFDIHN